jgi:hypothetical protein
VVSARAALYNLNLERRVSGIFGGSTALPGIISHGTRWTRGYKGLAAGQAAFQKGISFDSARNRTPISRSSSQWGGRVPRLKWAKTEDSRLRWSELFLSWHVDVCQCGCSCQLQAVQVCVAGLFVCFSHIGGYLGLRGTKWRGSVEDCITKSFMLCTPHQISFGWSSQEEWDGRSM